MTLLAKAPCRVDIAGGTIDIWPLYLFHEGACTVNFAVDRYASCRLATRRDRQDHPALAGSSRGRSFRISGCVARSQEVQAATARLPGEVFCAGNRHRAGHRFRSAGGRRHRGIFHAHHCGFFRAQPADRRGPQAREAAGDLAEHRSANHSRAYGRAGLLPGHVRRCQRHRTGRGRHHAEGAGRRSG